MKSMPGQEKRESIPANRRVAGRPEMTAPGTDSPLVLCMFVAELEMLAGETP